MPKRATKNASGSKKKVAKPKSKAPTAEELYHQAQIALQYDDAESARDALRQAVKLEPENVEVKHACMHVTSIHVCFHDRSSRPTDPCWLRWESRNRPWRC